MIPGLTRFRVYGTLVVLAGVVVAIIYAYFAGRADGVESERARYVQLERVHMKRTADLNGQINSINADLAAANAAAKTAGKQRVVYVKEETSANPATPATGCRIDDDAFRVLVDAFRSTDR